MSAVSLRLPDHLEQQLSEEARLSGQPRSQLMREALETLLSQRREGRAQAALRLAAEALASDAGACITSGGGHQDQGTIGGQLQHRLGIGLAIPGCSAATDGVTPESAALSTCC